MGNDVRPADPGSYWINERHILIQFFLFLLITSVLGMEGEGIVGGETSSVSEYPYHVSVQIKGKLVCGGGILNQQFVITAAHCVVTPNGVSVTEHVQVVGGTNDLHSNSSTRQTWDVTVIYVPHKYFIDFTRDLSGDIAILKLKQIINFSENPHLGYLELPSKHHDFVGEEAVVTGFGFNELKSIESPETHEITKKGKSDGKLRSLKTLILSQEACSIQKKYKISSSRLCTRIDILDNHEPRGPCNGDSGSPLAINKKVLIGVVSVGAPNCDERNGPSTHTRVTDYLDFIIGTLENRSDNLVLQIVLEN